MRSLCIRFAARFTFQAPAHLLFSALPQSKFGHLLHFVELHANMAPGHLDGPLVAITLFVRMVTKTWNLKAVIFPLTIPGTRSEAAPWNICRRNNAIMEAIWNDNAGEEI